jgi:hypothetical protein
MSLDLQSFEGPMDITRGKIIMESCCWPKFVIVQGLKKEVLNGPKWEIFHLVINCLLTLLIKELKTTLPLPRAQEEKN